MIRYRFYCIRTPKSNPSNENIAKRFSLLNGQNGLIADIYGDMFSVAELKPRAQMLKREVFNVDQQIKLLLQDSHTIFLASIPETVFNKYGASFAMTSLTNGPSISSTLGA
ncbi:hypothetical protein CEXT_465621 [Caerostris extrusa]|uniref:Uncharacterized protein n=1 Tax=Caerostris extrusa TaxID=172846 RepID=A0AAV4XQU4_CAEEX|nr:hypothetical protein CEXT_465621 [Caerostris extrusa]